MSRIGKKAIEIPSGVTVNVDGQDISVKGPKGEMALTLVDEVEARWEDENKALSIMPRKTDKRHRSMWGMQRTRVANLVEGVSQGFTKKLEINGVGYRALLKGKELQLQLGLSHDVMFPIPEGVDVQVPDNTTVIVSGADKQQVGQVAAKIREYRKPEPYKGKGIKYEGEYIFRKEGKKK
ncbi:LSU ribosomal protein L6P [Rhodothalassium salexigens DSM 2132]|uniref:Large ribosomal subunit protein uL6 n=1 Tax=Rhodothalassium salexigens DSM 2132 TaxID=1188247 RepID=A0A4R2PAI9_RHOSA|nr:50S ribosomal protein L6 [Rhodothalassium salexigens]MBB4212377.1 large subunit ribosomal protein L6 [Rhodothalassium salexigens DSM 2132]MBK1637801.1 50S ribosomal protein L6 [Rhodothalassium salexigens DSM 2132]TCP31992.1 LSU ribosomal protein L6P [Rhodothalassium salexigens DSM 2132]